MVRQMLDSPQVAKHNADTNITLKIWSWTVTVSPFQGEKKGSNAALDPTI